MVLKEKAPAVVLKEVSPPVVLQKKAGAPLLLVGKLRVWEGFLQRKAKQTIVFWPLPPDGGMEAIAARLGVNLAMDGVAALAAAFFPPSQGNII